MSRRTAITSTVVGLALLVGLPAAWTAQRGPDRAGSLVVADEPAPASSSADPTPEPASSPTAGSTTGTTPSVAPSPRPTDPLAALRPDDEARPARVRVPALDIDAAVVEVGVEPDGEMEIPADVSTVGWYRWGPAPGDDGSAVIAGHVDSRTQGRGAFFDLRQLEPGDTIEVVYDDGTSRTFAVQGRDVIDKQVVPLDDVFRRDGAPQLTLITCGGDFDYGTRHYRSNVVVVATPTDA